MIGRHLWCTPAAMPARAAATRYAPDVLNMPAQAELTAQTAAMWRSGSLAAPRGLEPGWPAVPDRPARDDSKAHMGSASGAVLVPDGVRPVPHLY